MFKPTIVLVAALSSFAAPVLAQSAPPMLQRVDWIPPGQAKKMDRHDYDRYHDDHYRHDDRRYYGPGPGPHYGFDPRRAQRLDDYHRYHLPPPPRGQRYVIDNDRVFRVDANTLAVIAAVGALGVLATMNHR